MKRISAFVIALFMLVAQLPIAVSAEINGIVDGSIAAFHLLTQTVSTETELSELNLPDTLLASIYHVDGEMITTSTETVPAEWNSELAYDENKAGTYVFSAKVEGYTLSKNAQLPMITVITTDKIQDTKTITDWSFLATEYSDYIGNEFAMLGVSMENQATFDAVVSMLPTQLSVNIENESNTSTVDITGWESVEYKQDVQDNWPVSGEFIFTAKLQEGFECEPLPSIRVIIGGISTYTNNTLTEGGLTVTASEGGKVEYTEGSGFTLKASGTYEISGKWEGKLNADSKNPKAVITVPENVIADVTLNGVTIDVSTINYASAFAIEANGKANITLTGNNFLKSGYDRAGLEVPETAEVMISGDGWDAGNGGTIKISSGTITATGGNAGAGIGGGWSGNGGSIEISGGTITATGGNGGAGIGGGWSGNGGSIEISGGTIIATGGIHGAGIGGGAGGHSGDITIIGKADVKAVGVSLNEIISSYISNNGTIRIGGNANVSAVSGSGSGIGGGSENGGSGIGGGAGAGDGCTVEIFGTGTMVTASGSTPGYDVGSGVDVTGGSLSVTDGATLKMTTKGLNVDKTNLEYRSCTIIDNNNISTHYDEYGAVIGPSTSNSSYGTSIKNTYSTTKDTINQTISSYNLKSLIRNKKTLTLTSNKVSMSFEPDALKSILNVIPSSARKITFTAVPADLSAYPNAAALIGYHPVYDFTISYKDSKGREHHVDINFPAGSVGISLNYTPTANETAGNLFMVSIDDKGNVTWLDYSSYNNEQVIAGAEHFSLYGIAYKTETPTYNDIKDHWAKTDIEFVVARGLLGGNDNLFTPDSLLTRGMFIEAFKRLTNIDLQNDSTHRLDEVLTREQVALLLADYAEQLEISMPQTLSAIKYADQSKISTTASKAVKLMQRAGVVRGKDGNQFAPQEKATKAEGAAILHRFIEAVIDPNVMNGWLKNDSGHWMYYKNGKAVTGWQTINKLRYYFNADGEMHEGWKKDKKKWYYWSNEGAVIGWKFINGKWYYFENDGVMASDTVVDGYQLGSDGAWIQ